jgi:hypothetical protein
MHMYCRAACGSRRNAWVHTMCASEHLLLLGCGVFVVAKHYGLLQVVLCVGKTTNWILCSVAHLPRLA